MMERMNTLPSYAEFEAAERARGCTEVIARAWDPGQVVPEHSHPFDARALVVAGEMWLTVDGKTRHLHPGDRFELARGIAHDERYGAEGATYWVARTA
jgi:quercetin dioxygenase-like cupin family protein